MNAGEAHLSANATSDGSFTNTQASYSPVNHLGIIGGYSTYSYKATDADVSSGNVNAAAHLAELGAGYYCVRKVGKIKFVGDIYGGAGGGKLQSDVDMNFVRSFIQPGIGLRTAYFELSFSYRFTDIKYYNLNANGHDSGYLAQQNLVYGNGRTITNTSYVFAEPAITLRGGYKFIKIQTQLVTIHPVSYVPWQYNNSQFNIGLTFELEDLVTIFRDRRHNVIKHSRN